MACAVNWNAKTATVAVSGDDADEVHAVLLGVAGFSTISLANIRRFWRLLHLPLWFIRDTALRSTPGPLP